MSSPADNPRPEPTSSLLQGVKEGVPGAWERLVRLYAPVVARWCRRAGLQISDVENAVQEVFLAVSGHVADFQRDPAGGGFHAWISTITLNKIRDHHRRRAKQVAAPGGSDFQERLAQEPAPESSTSDCSGAETGQAGVFRRALDIVRTEFTDRTWQAFWRLTVDQHDAADVAEELGMSLNAVYVAKSKVLGRLREELEGLFESPTPGSAPKTPLHPGL